MDAFFTGDRLHFFRPLTGKYREQVMACLRGLYAWLYSSLADYSRIVQRDLVLEVFQEAITRTPVLDDPEDDTAQPVRGDREQAVWMLNLLLEYSWLERHVDEVTLTSTYAFSRIGRLFTQPMHELEGGRFRTRHRNTRNTCNALRRSSKSTRRPICSTRTSTPSASCQIFLTSLRSLKSASASCCEMSKRSSWCSAPPMSSSISWRSASCRTSLCASPRTA